MRYASGQRCLRGAGALTRPRPRQCTGSERVAYPRALPSLPALLSETFSRCRLAAAMLPAHKHTSLKPRYWRLCVRNLATTTFNEA